MMMKEAKGRIKGGEGVCPCFGTAADPQDSECRKCHAQLLCIDAMAGHVEARQAEVREGYGLAKWMDEVEDWKAVAEAVEAELREAMGRTEAKGKPLREEKIRAEVVRLLEEEGVLDPWAAGWVTGRLFEGYKEEDGLWVRK